MCRIEVLRNHKFQGSLQNGSWESAACHYIVTNAPNIISFFRNKSITANQVEVPPEKTAMDEDGLPALIEQRDDIIRGFRFVQQGPDVVGACCAIPRWLVPLHFEIGVFPALPGVL